MVAGRVRFRVISSEDGMMLRQLLCRRLQGMSADAAADLIKAGGVYIGNTRIRLPMVRVAPGERITVYRQAVAAREIAPEALRIVYQGPGLVIVDKPAGVPATSSLQSARGTLAQALIHRLQGAVLRPYVGPIRPIPTGAAGLVAFTVRGQDEVSSHGDFLAAAIESVDRLLLRGHAPDHARCEAAVILGRSGRLRPAAGEAKGVIAAVSELRCLDRRGDGPAAASLCEIVSTSAPGALAEVHAACLGFPVLREAAGDEAADAEATGAQDGEASEGEAAGPAAGPAALDDGPRLFVRHRLRLRHPHSDEAIEVTAELPAWARA